MNIRMFKLGQDSRLQLNSKVLAKKSGVFFGALMLPSGQNLHQHLYRKMRLKVVIVYFHHHSAANHVPPLGCGYSHSLRKSCTLSAQLIESLSSVFEYHIDKNHLGRIVWQNLRCS